MYIKLLIILSGLACCITSYDRGGTWEGVYGVSIVSSSEVTCFLGWEVPKYLKDFWHQVDWFDNTVLTDLGLDITDEGEVVCHLQGLIILIDIAGGSNYETTFSVRDAGYFRTIAEAVSGTYYTAFYMKFRSDPFLMREGGLNVRSMLDLEKIMEHLWMVPKEPMEGGSIIYGGREAELRAVGLLNAIFGVGIYDQKPVADGTNSYYMIATIRVLPEDTIIFVWYIDNLSYRLSKAKLYQNK